MHTLEELRSGKLQGLKRVKISQNLTEFPMEILDLADTLEILDLSFNSLSSLPKEISRLTKLKIAFFSNNLFTAVPSELKECRNLYMLGFKANKIQRFDEDILPLSISWLILTDNKIPSLPDSMGKLVKLQKLVISGNQIQYIPNTMVGCVNLELVRISANKLQEIPSWFLNLPKLSWLAFSGNPCVSTPKFELDCVEFESLHVGKLLGEGASGEIYKAYSKELNTDVAIKFFKGSVTSDGYAKDEMNACLGVKKHENLINVIAKISGADREGLLLEYIPTEFKNLGNPPNFDTCTRDTYEDDLAFSVEAIHKISSSIASVATHMHEAHLMHGDLYAHNILINSQSKCYLGDFGAASFYDSGEDAYEKLEVRAYGCLLEDLLQRCSDIDSKIYKSLDSLKIKCLSVNLQERPFFKDMFFE